MTFARGAAICRNVASARPARSSWRKPSSPFSTTIARITPASTASPATAEMTAATISTQITRSLNCPPSRRHHGAGGAVGNSFGP